MRALGAEVILIDQMPGSRTGQVSGGDLALVEDAAQRITRERNAFRADQFHLESSSRAHYLHTAPEILKQADGKIDAFCDYAGTGGSFAGCAAAFKKFDPNILCYIVEPAEAACLGDEDEEGGGDEARDRCQAEHDRQNDQHAEQHTNDAQHSIRCGNLLKMTEIVEQIAIGQP